MVVYWELSQASFFGHPFELRPLGTLISTQIDQRNMLKLEVYFLFVQILFESISCVISRKDSVIIFFRIV